MNRAKAGVIAMGLVGLAGTGVLAQTSAGASG